MRKYDDEFKNQAVKKVLDGQSAASVAHELGINEGMLYKWKALALQTSSNAEKEVVELKKRLKELQIENEILSSPLHGIFGRGS